MAHHNIPPCLPWPKGRASSSFVEENPALLAVTSIMSTEAPTSAQDFSLSRYTRAISLSLCGISILSGICLATWVFRNRHARVVRASQPFFLYLICVGSIVTVSSIIPHTMDPSTVVSETKHVGDVRSTAED